jgi:anti-anti-sigma factor
VKVETAIEQGIATVRVSGDVDMATTDHLRDTCLSALADDVTTLRIDLADCTFMDSMGLGALVSIYNHTEALSVGLKLDNVPDGVRRIMEITALTTMFGIDRG